MENKALAQALAKLAAYFAQRDWKYLDVPPGSKRAKTYAWPGPADENIMICVHKGPRISEEFHRQDFFFFNFAYKGGYGALSYSSDNYITVGEDECYIGQPFTGYALSADCAEEIIIIGVLIQKEAFFKIFLPVLSKDDKLFNFFLRPQSDDYADEFIRVSFDSPQQVRTLLEMMVVEYASPGEDTQEILQPLVLALLMLVARRYRQQQAGPQGEGLAARIIRYMQEHTTVTLKGIAAHFSYHPNYISALLRRETGQSFTELLLRQRMQRARTLLEETPLAVEEIGAMLGYANSSNFYKAFRAYYGCSPRGISKRKR